MPYGCGPVKFNPRGEWDSETAYGAYDVVTRNGSSYWAKLTPDVGNDPEVNSPDQWQLLAQKGEQGTQGDPGTPGATWHNGSGSPSGEVGTDGDYYLDTDSDDIYEKSSGSWSQIGNIRGQQGEQGDPGADGATWHSGSGAPGGELGNDGDRYLDTDSGDVYLKSEGSWNQTGNIRGPQGERGEPGQDATVPVGTIIDFAGPAESIPEKWMPCRGQALSSGDYPDLWNAIRDGLGNEHKPEEYLALFARFVRENPEHVEAIRVLLDRPQGWSTGALTELRQKLALVPQRFTEDSRSYSRPWRARTSRSLSARCASG